MYNIQYIYIYNTQYMYNNHIYIHFLHTIFFDLFIFDNGRLHLFSFIHVKNCPYLIYMLELEKDSDFAFIFSLLIHEL